MLKLVGQGSVITIHLEHPIHLTDDGGGVGKYQLALYGLYSENNIANLRSDGRVYFWNSRPNALLLEIGHWTADALQAKCRKFIKIL